MKCRHCREAVASRPRRLCWSCYYAPGVRELYPTSKLARHGVEDYNGRVAEPARPTRALPGTPQKVDILARRAALGQALWHPHDAQLESADQLLCAG